MPQRKTKIKSVQLDKIHRLRNRKIKAGLHKTVKKYLELVSSKKIDEARTQLKAVMSQLDRAVKKNVIHKNTASRRKSRLSLQLKA